METSQITLSFANRVGALLRGENEACRLGEEDKRVSSVGRNVNQSTLDSVTALQSERE